jgi:hypothetical protein
MDPQWTRGRRKPQPTNLANLKPHALGQIPSHNGGMWKPNDIQQNLSERGSVRRQLYSIHGTSVVRGNGEVGNEGTASDAHIQRRVSGNDAVVATAQGDRKLLQRTLQKLFFSTAPDEVATFGSSFSRRCAGSPIRPNDSWDNGTNLYTAELVVL